VERLRSHISGWELTNVFAEIDSSAIRRPGRKGSVTSHRRLSSRRKPSAWAVVGMACLLLFSPRALAEEEWTHQVQNAVEHHQISAALAIVENRLAEAPHDMDAHAWRGRLLAWSGDWQAAASEYHLVLGAFPHDEDMLLGLADVLLWQKKYSESLAVLEEARSANPQNPAILLRRARVLVLLQRIPEAREQYKALLTHDPTNHSAIGGLKELTSASRYELRVGEEADFFSYTENANVETVTLTAHWNERWTTGFGISPYHLFGENAVKIWADAAYTFHKNNWVRVLGAGANPQDVVPEREVLIEYGHGFRFSIPGFKGLESSWQENSLWYRGAQVITLNTTQIFYLPRDWTWTLSATGARTRFGTGTTDWVPSGSTKIGFPLFRRLSGNVLFAVGAENFAQVDQIGRLSARTYGAGLRYRFAEGQDVTAFVARQEREHDQTQTSLGLSYGIRF
jgi:tetratricopeptide (TPR) repeat protein